MNKEQALDILEQHQLWRRGLPPYDETGGMPYTPQDLGIALDAAIKALEAQVDYEQALQSKRDLARKIDVIINGENAAPQASLCDLVGDIERLVNERNKAMLVQS